MSARGVAKFDWKKKVQLAEDPTKGKRASGLILEKGGESFSQGERKGKKKKSCC